MGNEIFPSEQLLSALTAEYIKKFKKTFKQEDVDVLDVGDFILRPSSEGEQYIIATFKLPNGTIQDCDFLFKDEKFYVIKEDEFELTTSIKHHIENLIKENLMTEIYKNLFIAISVGDQATINKILQSGVDPNFVLELYGGKLTPLMCATHVGNLEIVQLLLHTYKADPNFQINGLSSLFIAAQKGHLEITKTLLLAGADPNKNQTVSNPLAIAVLKGHIAVVKTLIFAGGADPDIARKSDIPPGLLEDKQYKEISFLFESVPPNQNWFKSRMTKLDFKAESNAFCFGVANMGRAAILTLDYDPTGLPTFNARFRCLATIPTNKIAAEVNQVKQKIIQRIKNIKIFLLEKYNVKDENELASNQHVKFRKELQQLIEEARQQLSDKERITADIPTFFEGLEIFQELFLYKEDLIEVMEKSINKKQSQSSALVRSKTLEELGGEVQIDLFTGVYSTNELITYFKLLKATLREEPLFNYPISLELKSGNHSITVGYHPRRNAWIFLDANKLPATYVYSDSEIAERVAQAFFFDEATFDQHMVEGFFNHTAIFSTSIFIAKDPDQTHDAKKITEHENHCKEKMLKWKQHPEMQKIHEVVPEKAKFVDSDHFTWLYLTAENEEIEKLNSLLLAASNHHNLFASTGYNPLFIAIKEDQLQNVKALLADTNVDPNICDDDGCTALFLAATRDQHDIVDELLAHKKINPNVFEKEGYPPLKMVVYQGNYAMTKKLLSCPTINATDPFLPIRAIKKGNHSILKLLLAHPQVDPNSQNKEGCSLLCIAAARGNYESVAEILKHPKVDPNMQNKDGESALFVAASMGKLDIVKLLLADKKVNVNVANKNGETPLDVAIKRGHVEVAEALKQKKNYQTTSKLHWRSSSVLAGPSEPTNKEQNLEPAVTTKKPMQLK